MSAKRVMVNPGVCDFFGGRCGGAIEKTVFGRLDIRPGLKKVSIGAMWGVFLLLRTLLMLVLNCLAGLLRSTIFGRDLAYQGHRMMKQGSARRTVQS